MIETVGSSAWLRRVFEEEARDDLFAGHAPQEQPVLVLLGGQPAAGKTRAQHAILAEHVADDLVEITGDDLREYHPDFRRLATRAPFEMPAATAPVSGGLVKLALDHALERRYSVLLEGTFRDPGMVTGTATRFAEAGYRVEVVAVATPAPVSRLSAEMRSLGDGPNEPGRWTPPEAHETALAGSVVGALLVALLSVGVGRAVMEHPELPEDLVAQVDLDSVNFVSNAALEEVLSQTDATPAQVEEAVQLNEEQRLRALKLGLLVLAGISAIAILPASRLPRYKPHEIPAPDAEPEDA
ncbi:MAG: zeta toxin family protein [Microbacterium sp.]|uniref:zeta toxin family protein n=1 Tax=Microbacterium sp. TaxID=51671 RepID=UPI0019BDF34B|nr:zeta toxin family protein [Microbacterium sp.]MBD3757341.1 zeta toxin family protein [Microbacterium sp.]